MKKMSNSVKVDIEKIEKIYTQYGYTCRSFGEALGHTSGWFPKVKKSGFMKMTDVLLFIKLFGEDIVLKETAEKEDTEEIDEENKPEIVELLETLVVAVTELTTEVKKLRAVETRTFAEIEKMNNPLSAAINNFQE